MGSHLVDYHLELGDTVIGIDNLCTGNLTNLSSAQQSQSFTFINADISKGNNFPAGCEVVYHLASPASPPKYMSLAMETMMANSTGTINLLEYAQSNQARFLYASTSEIYGDPEVHPQIENYWGNVNPIGPRSVYDEAKRFGETLVAHHVREGLVDAVIVRIFNTYGPRMDPFDGRVVSTFLRQMMVGDSITIHGDGSTTRSYCFVSDIILGLYLAAMSHNFGPINLGSTNEVTLLELANVMSAVMDAKLKITYVADLEDNPTRRKPDISRAHTLLGWSPTVELRDGITKMAQQVIEPSKSI